MIGRTGGCRPAGAVTLGLSSWFINIGALVYGVAAIIILSIEGGAGMSLFENGLVPLSVDIAFVAGPLYLLILRPKENVREEARSRKAFAATRP